MNQYITIAQLAPNLRGSFTLRFEVVSVQPSSNNPDQISLHIADESGCINAYFNNHGKHIKPGNVYELTNLKCKVVDHSLRLELAKDSKIARVKFDMAFKDLVNNLSEKFYVSKTEHETISVQKSQPKQEGTSKQQAQKSESSNSQADPSSNRQNGKKKESKSASQVQNDFPKVKKDAKSDKPEEKKEKHPIEKDKGINSGAQDKSNRKEKQTKNHIPQKEQLKNQQKQTPQEKVLKKKYVEKKSQPSFEPQHRQRQKEPNKIKHSNERILLKDIYLHQERDVNLFVQIETKTTINKDTYILVRGCDSSGAAYLQFDSRCHLENKTWYCLKRFTVYGDKNYGFVASQQSYSTYDILEQYDQVPDHRPIYFPKNK